MLRGILSILLPLISGTALAYGDCCDYPGQHLAHDDRLLDQASADINGDGAPDLAVAIVDGPIRVYLSDDSGAEPVTLANSTDYSIELSDASATSLRFADVDGDQNLDLVTSTSAGFDGKGAIEYFSGNGDGTFQTPSQRQVFDPDKPVDDVKLIDVDGDGNRDAVAHVLNEINPLNADYTKYRAGDGNGGFAGTLTDLPMRWTLQSGNQVLPTRFYTPDLNQDGEPDLLSLNKLYMIWRINSGGLLNPANRGEMQLVNSTAYDPHLESAAFGQLDSDANLEMAVTSYREEQVYLLEFSGGTFSQESYGPLVNEPVTTPRSVAITDLDGDGLDDLVISTRDAPHSTAWYRRTGDGTFAAPKVTRSMAGRDLLPFGDRTLSVGDINLEYVRLLHLDDDDRLSPLDIEQKDSNDNPVDLSDHVTADVNNDGNPDVTLLANWNLRVLLGDGTGDFSLHTGGAVSLGMGDSIAGADFDGDGHFDVATAGGGGSCELIVALGDSAGTLAPQSAATCNDNYPSASVNGLASADFDGQSGPDLVVLNGGTFEVLLNPGDGDFSQATYQRAGLSEDPESLLVADVDGQNGPDLIGTETFDEQIHVYLNNGDGSFAGATTTSFDQWTRHLGSGDFNGDGDADLVLLDYDGGSQGIRVLSGNGDGTFNTTPLITHPMAPESNDLRILDYNDDGLTDLLVATGDEAGAEDGPELLVLLENQGNNSFAAAGRFGYSIRSTGLIEGAAIADFDGDNDTDLLAYGDRGVRSFLQAGSGSANPNNSPTGQDDSLSRVAGFAVNEDLVSLTGITDPDGDSLSFSASGVPSGLSVGGSGQLTGTPDATALANSPHDIVLTADDGEAQLDVTVTLTVTNQAPVASNLQPVGIDVGDSLDVDLGAGFNDPDGHDLTFSVQNLPAGLSVDNDGRLTGTVDQAMVDNAPYTVMLTADDGFATTQAAISLTAGNTDTSVTASAADSDSGGAPSPLWLLGLTGLLAGRRGRLARLTVGSSLLMAASLAQALNMPAELNLTGASAKAITHADINGDGNMDIVTTSFGLSHTPVRVWLGDGLGGVGERQDFSDPDGGGARDLAAADFNGDGYDDVVVANRDDDSLTLWEGASDGTLALSAASPISTPSANALAILDANGDGNADIAVGSYDDTIPVKLYPGQGDGNFGTAETLSVSFRIRDIAVGDMDADGELDLLLGTSVSDIIPAYGDGSGNFSAPSTIDTGSGSPVGLADLDGDGDSDILYGEDASPAMRVMRSQGNRSFAAAEQIDSCGQSVNRSIVTGDVNNDGRPDVFATDGVMGGLGLWIADSNGDLQDPLCLNGGGSTRDVTLADLNNDGRLDLVGLSEDQSGWVAHLNNGAGDFGALPTVAVGSPLNGRLPGFVALADMNDDGRDDLVTINTDQGDDDPGTTSVYLRQSDGELGAGSHYEIAKDPRGLALADMDNNGALDVVTGSHTVGIGDFAVRSNDGTGDLGSPTGLGSGMGTDSGRVTDVEVSDFDGDGLADVAMGNGGGTGTNDDQKVFVALGKDDGAYPYTVIGNTVGLSPEQLDVGDMDEDGHPDMMVSTTGDIVWMENNSFGSFSSGGSTAVAGTIVDLQIADLDDDGHLDVAALTGETGSDDNGYIHILPGNGDGTFAPTVEVDLAPHLNSSDHDQLADAKALDIGDMNGDGLPDLVATLGDENQYVIATQKTNGNFNRARRFLVQRISRPAGVTIGDINNDGLADLVIADPLEFRVTLVAHRDPQPVSVGGGNVAGGGGGSGGGALPGIFLLWLMVRRWRSGRA